MSTPSPSNQGYSALLFLLWTSQIKSPNCFLGQSIFESHNSKHVLLLVVDYIEISVSSPAITNGMPPSVC